MFKYVLLALFILSGCQNTDKNTNSFTKFPLTEEVKFENFQKFEYGIVGKMFIHDTSLFVYDWTAKGRYFFYEYNLDSRKIVNKYMPHGRQPGKALGSLSSGVFNNHLWMYDLILSKIILVKFGPSNSEQYKEYPFSSQYYNLQFIDSSKVIANGNYKLPNKLQELDINSGKINASYGVIGNTPKDIPFYGWKRANESLLMINPTKDKVVMAHRFNDEIEIFDLKDRTNVRVKGPENFELEFKYSQGNNNEDMIERTDKSRYIFSQIAVTKKFIYVSYSGELTSSKNIDYCKTVFIYNWDGAPVKRLMLDRYICGFTISNDDKTVYAYDVKMRFIVKAKI